MNPIDAVLFLLRYIACLLRRPATGDGGACDPQAFPRGCFRSHTSILTNEQHDLLTYAQRVLLTGGGLRLSAAQVRDVLHLCIPEGVQLPFIVSYPPSNPAPCSWFILINGSEYQSCLDVSATFAVAVRSRYGGTMTTATCLTRPARRYQNTSLQYVLQRLMQMKVLMAEAIDVENTRAFNDCRDQFVKGILELLLQFAREWTSTRTSESLMRRIEENLI